jgi:hypothetical protein
VDNKKLQGMFTDVIEDIRDDAKHSLLEKSRLDHGGEAEHLMHDAEVLKNVEMLIPEGDKSLSQTDKDKIARSVRDVMGDLGGGVKFEPDHVTREYLEKMGIEEDKIREIMKLQGILVEVEAEGHIDKNKLTHD